MTAWWGQNSSSRWGQNGLSFPHVKLATEPGALSSFDLRPQEAEFISGLDADLSFDARIVAFDTRYESVVSHRERDHRGEGEGWVFVFRVYFETHQYQERHRVAVPAPTFNGSGSKPACAPQSEAVGQATKNAVYTTRADVGVGGRSAPSMKQMTFVKNGMVKTYKTDVRGDVVMGDDDDPVIEAVTVMTTNYDLVTCDGVVYTYADAPMNCELEYVVEGMPLDVSNVVPGSVSMDNCVADSPHHAYLMLHMCPNGVSIP